MDVYAELARKASTRARRTREDFAAVAVKNRHHGSLNPLAQYGAETTVEEVLAAREIVWPLTLPMCSPISDGAAAVVLAASDRVGATSGPASASRASILASGTRLPDGERRGGTVVASAKAYEAAGIGPDDLDMSSCTTPPRRPSSRSTSRSASPPPARAGS